MHDTNQDPTKLLREADLYASWLEPSTAVLRCWDERQSKTMTMCNNIQLYSQGILSLQTFRHIDTKFYWVLLKTVTHTAFQHVQKKFTSSPHHTLANKSSHSSPYAATKRQSQLHTAGPTLYTHLSRLKNTHRHSKSHWHTHIHCYLTGSAVSVRKIKRKYPAKLVTCLKNGKIQLNLTLPSEQLHRCCSFLTARTLSRISIW